MTDHDALARRIVEWMDSCGYIRVPRGCSKETVMRVIEMAIARHLREALPTSEAKILTPDQVERARTILVCKQGHQQAIGGPGWKDYWMDSVAELLREVVGDE